MLTCAAEMIDERRATGNKPPIDRAPTAMALQWTASRVGLEVALNDEKGDLSRTNLCVWTR